MNTLLINAHPDFNHEGHFSLRLQAAFQNKFKQFFPDDELTIFNLYDNEVPTISQNELLAAWDDNNANVATISTELMSVFKAHHRIVIVTPVHNFNIPSRLKDYIDNLMIARETFKYVDTPDLNGKVSRGLMLDDYRLLVLMASGSIYTEDNLYKQIDYVPQYLQTIFQEMMGFHDFQIVRAEGTAIQTPQHVMTTALSDLNQKFDTFYR
ncbi:NAD(P)H-dependent oxidoreductase [Weissella diestrammenae]|uniref:FMN dependent NADH:quinone oxidoreductase n=1 Tax=Weissella diestrammenae TaxID=1162633 RepID=A0A7G9T579_9LACO|nr:NAD(P)H-dependent oxidoreductase [Weissella diestrammenae]MCM0583109.1 NAD(P)H-dependent oxidoreductase [Weissella diestrammenae]QNN75254.1 NAD(P)H-dependent oxidoreductase [Weissella diestrammenae]